MKREPEPKFNVHDEAAEISMFSDFVHDRKGAEEIIADEMNRRFVAGCRTFKPVLEKVNQTLIENGYEPRE